MGIDQEVESQEPETFRVCYADRIYVGKDVLSFREVFMLPFISQYPAYRVQGYILDVSEDGGISKAVEQMRLPDGAREDLHVIRSSPDEESVMGALWRLALSCDPTVRPNEVLLDLSPLEYPRIALACRGLASKWFFGRGPERPDSWPLENLEGPVEFDQLRDCITAYRAPQRPSALIVAPPHKTCLFAENLYRTGWSWLTFVQIANSTDNLDDVWPGPQPPDLVFIDIESFKTTTIQRLWTEAVWIIAADDDQQVERLITFDRLENAKQWSDSPPICIAWSPKNARALSPVCITKPLKANQDLFPEVEYYEPRLELEQLRDLWQTGPPQVAALVGLGGSGKTTLAYRLLKECHVTGDKVVGHQPGPNMPSADAIFVWDLHAKPFYEVFLRSFAEYLNPDRERPTSGEQCLTYIRQAVKERYLRRVLLVIDGLDVIQRPHTQASAEGQLQAPIILNLLEEIAGGKLPIFAIVTTRLEPVELKDSGKSYSCIRIGDLSPEAACNVLRKCGVQGEDAQLVALTNRFGSHAMTIYHLGRLLGDYYNGDIEAADYLPAVNTLKHTSDTEVDRLNRQFIQLFACYEEQLPKLELATLQRVAALNMPLSATELAQIFSESSDKDLARLRVDELQTCLEALHNRQFLTTHAEPHQEPMYFTHPALSYYFGNALHYDAEAINLGAREYFERQLSETMTRESWSTIGNVETDVAVRTRSAAVGPQDPSNQYPTSESALDLMERVIFHTVQAGHQEEARLLYKWRMGGDQHLESIGQVVRAQRIKRWLQEYY